MKKLIAAAASAVLLSVLAVAQAPTHIMPTVSTLR